MTTLRLSRFLAHVTFFPCLVCRQRAMEVERPSPEVDSSCPWDNCTAFTKAEYGSFHQTQTVFRITHHRCSDSFERFWLNDASFFTLIPNRLVYYVCTYTAVTCITVNVNILNNHRDLTALAESLYHTITFYVVITFTADVAGYQGTPKGFRDLSEIHDGRSPFNPRQINLTKTVFATSFVHITVISTRLFGLPVCSTVLLSSIVAPLSACMALFVLAGLFKNQTSGEEKETAIVDISSLEAELPILTKSWHLDSVSVLSSSRIRYIDLRVVALGFGVLEFEAVWSRQYWQMPAHSSILLTLLIMLHFLMNFIPTSQILESKVLVLAASALTGIFGHFDFLGFFAVYHDNSDGENKLSQPLKISLWYSVLLQIILKDGNIVSQMERRVQHSNADSRLQDPLLMRFQTGTSSRGLTWELRNARIIVALTLALGASQLDSIPPLPPHTIIASLTIMILVTSFNKRSMDHQLKDQLSISHLGALLFCLLGAWSIILLNGVWVFDFKEGWHAGAFGACVSYCFFTTYADRLKRWFGAWKDVGEGSV